MPTALKQPQLMFDFLLPAGRSKFALAEVATILSADGSEPVSIKSIRNAMEEGRLFGNRIPFSAPIGKEQRIRVEWMTRADVLQALLRTRTNTAQAQVDDVCQIVVTWSDEALDELMRYLVALRARRPKRG